MFCYYLPSLHNLHWPWQLHVIDVNIETSLATTPTASNPCLCNSPLSLLSCWRTCGRVSRTKPRGLSVLSSAGNLAVPGSVQPTRSCSTGPTNGCLVAFMISHVSFDRMAVSLVALWKCPVLVIASDCIQQQLGTVEGYVEQLSSNLNDGGCNNTPSPSPSTSSFDVPFCTLSKCPFWMTSITSSRNWQFTLIEIALQRSFLHTPWAM